MAEIFGAVGTGISLAHISAKGLRAFSRFRKDAIGADEEIGRLSSDLERRTAILESLYADLKQRDVQGFDISLGCIGACAMEIRAMKEILAVFGENLADGKSWWELLKTRMKFAWRKEEVNELRENMRAANETFTEALSACQFYLAKASNNELRRMRAQDLPDLSEKVDSMRVDDIPRMTGAIAASVTSQACGVMRVVITEGQETRATVQASNRELVAAIQELRQQIMDRAHDRIASPSTKLQTQDPSSALSQTSISSGTRSETRVHPETRQIISRQDIMSLPLGIASVGLRKERRKRVLTQKNKTPQDTDVAVDEEASYILTVVANFWILRKTVTNCNWKLFSPKLSRRHKNHPAFGLGQTVPEIIEFFQKGTLMINDVDQYGNSLLHAATQTWHYELCQWLLDNGADPHTTNDDLETAMFSSLRYPPPIFKSQEFYGHRGRILHLLVDKCQLDPNDINKDGETALEVFIFVDIGQFARLFRRSLELSTELEKNRIKDLFHSIAAGPGIEALLRLKYLLDEYRKAGFDQEESAGQKWWYTPDFLWQLVMNGFHEDEPWALEELSNMVLAGVDLHPLREGRTPLDSFLAASPGRVPIGGTKDELLRWLEFVHTFGTVTVRDYLKEEERLHPHGVLVEWGTVCVFDIRRAHRIHYHYQGEYPIFMVNYEQSPDSVTLTRGQLMLDLEVVDDRVPGAWLCDKEREYCERHGLHRLHRDNGVDWPELRMCEIASIASPPPSAVEDRNVSRWQLPDGRSGQLYDLWTISTAGFEHGDYTLETALSWQRDYTLHPLYLQYPHTWFALGHFHDPQSDDEDCSLNGESVGSSSLDQHSEPDHSHRSRSPPPPCRRNSI